QLMTDLSSRETMLVPQVDSSLRFLRGAPPIALDDARLSRDVNNAATLASSVGQQYEGARWALPRTVPDVRWLAQAAQPGRRTRAFGPALIALSFFTSLGLATLVASLLDRVDSRLRHPDQVIQGMRLPLLAALPHVSGRRFPAATDHSGEVIE